MAKYTNNEIPNKNTDWSYDPVSGLPFSGASVQQYIKDQLEGKAGCFHYDSNNNRFLVFADETNRDLYLDDPVENVSLLIGAFDAPFNYTASIELIDTDSVNYVQSGSTGNYIKAQFDVVNKSGASVGENVNVTITFRNGSAVSRIVRSVTYGSTLVLNIDEYLATGTNIVTLAAVGQNTLAATSIGLTYYAIRLELSDTFDISQHVNPLGNLDIAFNIVGGGLKRLEWYIDGVQVPYDSQNDDVTASEASRVKSIALSSYNLTNGRHNLQYRAYVETADGSLFYSDTMYRDFIVDNGNLQDYVTVVAFQFPYNEDYGTDGIIDPMTEPIPIYGAEQYSSKDIYYAINCYEGSQQMNITMDGNTTTHSVANHNVYTYTLQSFSSGETYLSFALRSDILEFNVYFEETRYDDLEEVTNGLVFALDKSDRTNTSDNRSSWSYGSYTGTMTGFSFTDRSGWTHDGLLIPDGASFITNYTPLSGNLVENGFTFEMEFETQRVLDDNEVICDLRSSGTGILITASEASITSQGGISVSTKYKSGVPLRVSFVINSPTATRNKNLLFIYIDGILAGAVNYSSTDSFTSNAYLRFDGSADASILVKQIRCYNRALSATEVLNNYILYRPTTQELVQVYDRNDILDENSQPSYEKLSAYTPVIIVTGDVEKLMNFDRSNKGTYVKMDKIEIINNLDPTKNLTLYDASMRCQGTSSMDYPRKNFRFYTAKDSADTTVDSYTTRVFDYQGHELLGSDRKYAFKDGSQAVNCWCLKADYAESSSTHNTGVARLWNTVMKNAVVNDVDSRHYVLSYYEDSKTPCRTLAQHAAVAGGYDKDVRTTVDGFPIVLFYHRYESDALICLGKYNWNNDKSTESVYGFCDIPGFDDSNVECWEVVNGDYPANTFDDVSSWDTTSSATLGWRNAFEARYPDDSGKASEATRANGALKTVADWVNSTKGASTVSNDVVVVGDSSLMTKFSTEKWQHLDVYKVAAYYVYLMRFGGVDQTVKNAMFTTEDGVHWFYINYDNDTILGVRNDGLLRFGYDIDRQSKDPDNQNAYCYAGHSSVLWNNLEADEEFMGIVKVVDQALFKAGLTYPNVINMFNVEQSGSWGERIHNYDYTYKYLDVWLDGQNNQLEKLQGPRRTHREWWLANRFAIYDAKNMTGQYLESSVNIKPVTSTSPAVEGDSVFVTPKVDDQVFGWRLGTDGTITAESGTSGTPIEFDLDGNSYYIGGSFFFFNAVYMQKIDFSAISQHIAELHLEDANSDVFDSYLEELVVSDTNSETNTTLSGINGIALVKYLRKIQMCNCTAITTISLAQNKYLEDVDFRGCTGLTSVEFPTAAPITSIQLPSSMQALHMMDLVDLTTLSVQDNGAYLNNINVSNCKPFTDSLSWLKTWITGKSDSFLEGCTVVVEGINWTDVDVDDLLTFGKIGNLTLKGKIQVDTDGLEDNITNLQEIYGDHCFESTNELWITGNEEITVFLGPDTIIEGEVAQYTFVVVGYAGTVSYMINNNTRTGVSINANTGQLSTTITNEEDSTLQIQASFIPSDIHGSVKIGTMNVTILQETYPSNSDITISGDTLLYDQLDRTYTATVANASSYTGMQHLVHTWSISGDLANYYRIKSAPANELSCVIECYDSSIIASSGKLRIDFTHTIGGVLETVAYKEIEIGSQSSMVAISRATNPEAMTVFWNKFGTDGTVTAGKVAHADYVTKIEAATFTSSDFGNGTEAGSIFYGSGLKHFEEIQYFVGLTSIPAKLFLHMTSITGEMHLPDDVTTVDISAFADYTNQFNMKLSGVYGNGVLTVTNSDHNQSLSCDVYFPNCTSWSADNLRYKNGINVYLPKCTSFSSSFYSGQGHTFILTLGYLGLGGSSSMPNHQFDLVVSKYCAATTSAYLAGSTGNNSPCNLVRNIYLEEGVTAFELDESGCLYDVASHTLLHTPGTLTGNYTIKSGTTAISQDAFINSQITGVTIPSTVTTIGTRAFSRCNGLTSLTLPDGLTSYAGEAFKSCTNLEHVIIPSSVTSGGVSSFDGCTKLLTVGPAGGNYNIEYGWTTTIPTSAFNYARQLTSITFSSTITTLKSNCFRFCVYVATIYSYPSTPPTKEVNNAFDNLGRDASTNTVYAPTTSTGYDNWPASNWTLSKTL